MGGKKKNKSCPLYRLFEIIHQILSISGMLLKADISIKHVLRDSQLRYAMFLLRKQSHMVKGFPGYLHRKNNSLHNSHVIAVSHAFTSKAFFSLLNVSTLSPIQFILTSEEFPEAQRPSWTTAL